MYNNDGEYNGGLAAPQSRYIAIDPIEEQRRLQEEIERLREEERFKKEEEKKEKLRLEEEERYRKEQEEKKRKQALRNKVSKIEPDHKSHFTLKWSASYGWSFGPNSACRSIESTTIGKTHPTLRRLNDFWALQFEFRFARVKSQNSQNKYRP